MTTNARAARLHAHGEPLVVEDIELPESDSHVAVAMAFAGVNPVDRYNAVGRVGTDLPLPRTIGSEGVGTYEGRPVIVRGPAFASVVMASPESLTEVPSGVPLQHAAAMGVAGVTGWRAVHELGRVTRDDKVLVLGASGGVGSLIVSMASHITADVAAQTGSADKAEFVSGLGASSVLVADAGGLLDQLGDFKPTVVFDALGGGFTGAAIEAMEPRGRLVIFGTSSDGSGVVPLQMLYRKSLRILGYGGLMETPDALAEGVRNALASLAAGEFDVVIDSVIELDDVNEALERLANRSVKGKLLLGL